MAQKVYNMKSCKKLLLALLILLSSFAFTFASATVRAENENKVKTQPFLPSTYFEYYKLNSPVDVCYDETNFYIAESNAIVIFDRETELYTRINCQQLISTDDWNVTKIDCYKGYVFILNASKIYYLAPNDRNTLIDSGIFASTYFYISGDRLYANTSSTIENWSINYDQESGISFNSNPDFVYNNISSSTAFVYSSVSGSLYYFNLNECTRRNLNEKGQVVFTHSTNYATYYNGKIYFTENNRLYEYDEALAVAPRELFNLNQNGNELTGFCLKDGKVLAVNKSVNEIWEFDLETSAFTGKFVATYKTTSNRLTEQVVDVVIDGEYIYALQKTSLLRFSTNQTTYEEVVFSGEFSLTEFNPLYISVINNDLLISNGHNLKAFKLSNLNQTLTAEEVTLTTSGTWEENNICGLYAFDGEFYLLKNRTISNVQYALIYKLKSNANGYEVNSEQYLYKKDGTGISFTINSFGELYLIAVESNLGKRVTCYDLINKTETSITKPISEGVTKIISDFENVFVLDQNTIYNLTNDTYYKIEKSANFDTLDTPVSFCANMDSGITYLLYKGYILQTNELPLITPNTYLVPDGYNTTLEQTPTVATLSDRAKLFLVWDNQSGYFKCEHITSATNAEYLIIADLSEDFCLIALEENTYIARKQDLTQTTLSTFTPEFTHGYYVTKAGVYAQPMLNTTYRLGEANAYSLVTVINGISVNSTDYYLIELQDGSVGYVEKSFIVEQILETAQKENYYLATCKATEVYSADGSILGNIAKGTVKVYGKENGLYKISYANGFGYVKANAIVQKDNKALRNSLVLMIVATSFTITAIYLQIRHNRKFDL